jgi:hypothetical protein
MIICVAKFMNYSAADPNATEGDTVPLPSVRVRKS